MRIFNNKDKLLDIRNQIVFIWDSVLLDVESMSDMNDLYIVNSMKYVVDDESVEKMNSLINRLPVYSDKFFDLLENRTTDEVEEHYEFMKDYSNSILSNANRIIDWVRNHNTRNRIDITRCALSILLKLKKNVEAFIEKFELKK